MKARKEKVTEEEWRTACVRRWAWVREWLEMHPELDATDVAKKSVKVFREGASFFSENKILLKIEDKYRKSSVKYEVPQVEFPKHTWEQVFLKLDLEDTLLFFDQNPDFQGFYEKLEIAKEHLTVLTIPVIPLFNVKSGYYFWSQVLTKLKKLRYLEICGLPEATNTMPIKAIRSLNKGFLGFLKEAKGQLQGISLHNFNVSGNAAEICEKFFSPLSQMPELMSIKFTKTNLLTLQNATKTLSNIITNLKNLEELVLSQQALGNVQQAKEIADGLMRAKQLRIVNISANTAIGTQGLGSIIYNLSFSPKLLFLNVAGCTVTGSMPEVVESLYKMLRISASLEILNLS